ncbi:MAG: amino acid permease [Leptospirales bacterium]|nr:amino acid permease [Leptospirales bacterium]
MKRQLGFWSATIIVVANMIGSGIFGNTGFIQGMVGSPLMVLALWFLGGLIALAGALCYAELSTIYPHAGGEYVYLKNIFGGLPSFLTGWISLLVGFAAPAAAAALLSGVYVSDFLRLIYPVSAASAFFLDATNRKLLACGLVILFGVFHSLGVKQGSRLQNFLTGAKILVILLFAGGGLIMAHASLSMPIAEHFSGTLKPEGLGVGLLFVMFAYSGWNAASYLAEEIKDPVKNLPRSLVAGTLFTMLIYLVMNYVYYLAVPGSELAGKPDPAAQAATRLFGSGVNSVFHVAFSFMLLSTLSACVMIGPRVYYAMARDGLFFSFASKVSSNGVPVQSIVVQCAISLLYILLGTYEDIQTYMGFSLSLFPVLTVFGLILHRKRHPEMERGYRSPLFPLLPIFFIIFSALIVLTSYLGRPHEGNFALSIVMAGVPMFYLWLRFRDRQTNNLGSLIGIQVLCAAAAVVTYNVMSIKRNMQIDHLWISHSALGFEVICVAIYTFWLRRQVRAPAQ